MARRADPDRSANHSMRGIESLLTGTSDLSMELGIPGQFGDERIVDDGIGGIYEESLMRHYIGMGVRLAGGRRPRLYDHRCDRAGKTAARLPLSAIAPDCGGGAVSCLTEFMFCSMIFHYSEALIV